MKRHWLTIGVGRVWDSQKDGCVIRVVVVQDGMGSVTLMISHLTDMMEVVGNIKKDMTRQHIIYVTSAGASAESGMSTQLWAV